MTSALGISLFLSSFLIGSLTGFASTSSGSAGDGPSLTVRVYDYARVPHATLAGAQKVAAEIFLQAGVEMNWLDCPLAEAQQLPACNRPLGPSELALRIIRGSKAARTRLYTSVCGASVRPPQGQHGTLSTVFYDCVERIAEALGLSQGLILGHVATHELGHLLLPTSEHAELGIMRAQLNVDDWLRAAQGPLRFTPQQAKELRIGVFARVSQHELPRVSGIAPLE